MKPTNGSWLPTKALGGGKVSTCLFSVAMSSKLLVSMSPFSSGTTGATAWGQKQRESHGPKGGEEEVRTVRGWEKGAMVFYIIWGGEKIKTWCYRYLNLKCVCMKPLTFFPGVNSTPALLNELSAGWHRADTTAFPIQCLLCALHTVPLTSKDLTPALSLQEQPGH